MEKPLSSMTPNKILCDVPLKPYFLTCVKTSSMWLPTSSYVKSKTYAQHIQEFLSQIYNFPNKIYLKQQGKS